MKRRKLFLLARGLFLIAIATTSTRAQTKIPEHYLRERGVKRVRALKATFPALSRAAADQLLSPKKSSAQVSQRMKLDLFPDVSFSVDLDHVEQQSKNDLAWFGRVDGAPYGQATFVLSGNALIGAITRSDGKIYQIRTAEDGTQWSIEIDQSEFPEESDPISGPEISAELQPDMAAYGDDGSTIDVMVLYTPAARQAAGGTTSMQQLVQLGIAETNQGYTNSGVVQRVRLVESREVTYTEAASFSTDLSRLANTSDGILDEVAALRNTYGADLVSLWRTANEESCGVGYQLANTTFSAASLSVLGFNVVAHTCATGYYSFGHEMGHNMGAHHARDDLDSNGNPPQGPYPYGYGYKQTSGTKFRTIMAYDTNCTCARINYWSNPNVQYSGRPTGIDHNSAQGAANYLVLNNTRTIVANFRASVSAGTTPTDTTGPSLTITSHTNNQSVSTSSITITGTATDSGRGDNGVSSVTINNVRATGDTATGSGTANWSRTLTLTAGANTITVVAKDNSAAQNSTTSTITINFGTSTTSTTSATSATASTSHVFPQFADGRFSDGSYYRTTLMISNPSSTTGTSCTLQFRGGLTVPGFATNYAIGASGWVIAPTSGTQNFQSGYATLQCSANVEAQLLYSYYGSSGVKISEATVFSSPAANALGLISDERDGARFAIAIANDSDRSVTYTIYVDATGFSGNTQRTLSARSSVAGFLGDLISGIPANRTAAVTVVSNSTADSGSVIGLRFTGGVFTTMPASPVSSVGRTASTYHIFPQFADGRFSDGSYYRTSRLYLNPNSSAAADCTTRLRGLSTDGNNTFTLSLPASTSFVGRTNGTQTFQSGYATLQCSASVYAQAVYSFYGPNGGKLSEATVFSSPAAQRAQILADNREGARVGIAIANDSDQVNSYTILVSDANGATVGSTSRTLQPRTSIADFVDNFVALPPNYYGQVIVTSTGGTASIIGLRFTGTAFTTIPATVR